MEENNRVLLVGRVDGAFEFAYENYGEKFYTAFVETMRSSEVYDRLPIIVSEKLLERDIDYTGSTVKILGEYRSFNSNRKLCLNVFANTFEVVPDDHMHINEIYIEGFICKTPVYRQTPKGRFISELIVAVNRRYGKSDYLPCIAWGRNAGLASRFEVGTLIRAEGRMQSRPYKKIVGDKEETKVAYEVSISWLNVCYGG